MLTDTHGLYNIIFNMIYGSVTFYNQKNLQFAKDGNYHGQRFFKYICSKKRTVGASIATSTPSLPINLPLE